MAVVATGFFDGVHLGHRQVIKTLVSSARQKEEEALVITFSSHPRTVLQQEAGKLRFLTTPEERESLLRSLGVDRVVQLPFTRDFASMSAERYIREILAGRFGASSLVLGYDNRVGSDRLESEGIRPICGALGMESAVVPPCLMPDGTAVSSTAVRKMIAEGNIERANAMLGYRYGLSGVVVSGKQLGRTIGFPTANTLPSNPLKLVPGRGVYLSEVDVLGEHFYGMTNVGDIVETNIFDFDDSIYGMEIGIRFISRLRDMRRIDSVAELKKQLSRDRTAARERLNMLLE